MSVEVLAGTVVAQGVGLDALLGLLPGVGDLVGSGISAAITFDAVRAWVPVPRLVQMAWNLLLGVEPPYPLWLVDGGYGAIMRSQFDMPKPV